MTGSNEPKWKKRRGGRAEDGTIVWVNMGKARSVQKIDKSSDVTPT